MDLSIIYHYFLSHRSTALPKTSIVTFVAKLIVQLEKDIVQRLFDRLSKVKVCFAWYSMVSFLYTKVSS